MKLKPTTLLAALPVLALGYVAYHPGIAFAESPLAQSLTPTTFGQGGEYTIDPAHTSVGFDVGHFGLSRVQGRFNKLSGSLQIDAKDLTKSSVKVVIEAASIDTNVAPRDNHLRSADFFEVEKYPEIRFESTRIKRKGNGYVADGNLTMKGVSKPVSIEFRQYGPIKDPWGATRIGVVAEPLTLRRTDFGINYDTSTVSDDVVVRLSLEATEKRAERTP